MKKILFFVLFIVFTNCLVFASDTLKYDNGIVDYSYSSGVYYWGVLFGNNRLFLPETALVNITDAYADICSLKIYSDSNFTPLTQLYSATFIDQEGWNKIPVLNNDTMSSDFWIIFYIPTSDSGPKMASDDDGGTGHSYYSINGSNWSQFSSADFLIRCIGEYEPYPHDISALRFISPDTSQLYNNNHITPAVYIANIGTNNESFYAYLTVYKRVNKVYAESVFVNDFQTGDSLDVVFPPIDLVNGELYRWIFSVEADSDDYKENDTIAFNTTTCPVGEEKRAVFMELFDASGCTFCPPSAYAMDSMAAKYTRDSLVLLQYQVNDIQGDEFSQYGLDKLNNIYDQQGTPYMWFDSDTNLLGTTDVNLNFARFDSVFCMRKEIPSPVKIEFLDGSIAADSGHFDVQISVTGDISKYYDFSTMTHHLTLEYSVYENNIYDPWPNGDSTHNHIVRIANDIDLSAISYGDVENLEINFPVGETGGRPWDSYTGDYHNVGFAVAVYNKCAVNDSLPLEVLQARDASSYDGIKVPEREDKTEDIEFNIYKNILKIKSESNSIEVDFYDISGKRVFHLGRLNGKEIDLTSIIRSDGVYFVKVEGKRKSIIKKIILIK